MWKTASKQDMSVASPWGANQTIFLSSFKREDHVLCFLCHEGSLVRVFPPDFAVDKSGTPFYGRSIEHVL